jgi:hypothetical protein
MGALCKSTWICLGGSEKGKGKEGSVAVHWLSACIQPFAGQLCFVLMFCIKKNNKNMFT